MLNPNGDRDQRIPTFIKLEHLCGLSILKHSQMATWVSRFLANVYSKSMKLKLSQDGLRRGHVHFKSPAASIPMTDSEVWAHELKQRLEEVFNNYPEIARLYPDRNFEDPTWVCNRWLELLPLPGEVKQDLLSENNFSQMLAYLAQLFAENEQQNELN